MAEKAGSGPGKEPLQFRTSPSFEWKGLNPHVEPQDLPPDVPRQLTNMRLIGGRIESRGGQELVENLDTPVTGMTDYTTSPEKLMLGSSYGILVSSYSQDQDPEFQEIVYSYGRNNESMAMTVYGGDLYFADHAGSALGVKDRLYVLRNISPAPGQEAIDTSAGNQALKVWEVPSPYTRIRAIEVFDGELFISVTIGAPIAGATTSAVYRFDGTTFTLDTSGIRWINSFGVYREMLCGVVNHSSDNTMYIRNSAGAWSTVAGGLLYAIGSKRSRSYKDVMYWMSGDVAGSPQFFSFNGTSVTDLRTVSGIGVLGVPGAIEVANGLLYYVWYKGSATTGVWVGTFDGTTWDPFHKNITAQFSDVIRPMTMTLFKGSLCVTAYDASDVALLRSPGSDTDGTWTKILIGNTLSSEYSLPVSALVY